MIVHIRVEICQGFFLPIAIFAIECCEAREDRREREREQLSKKSGRKILA